MGPLRVLELKSIQQGIGVVVIEARVEEVIFQPKLGLHIDHVGRGDVVVSARDASQDTQHDIVNLAAN